MREQRRARYRLRIAAARPMSSSFKQNPYLHVQPDRVYNPLTDHSVSAGDPVYSALQSFRSGGPASPELLEGGWVIPAHEDLSRRYRLKIVSLETSTTCNQKCYFCPVSIAPREDEVMTDEMFGRIVDELLPFRTTLEGVFLQSYNEPTIERRFVQHVRTLFAADLPVAVLTNASGLTPAKVDAIMDAGQLRYLCVNLSTLDRERYAQDRGGDHLAAVLRNVDYMRDKPVAAQMRIIVLGQNDATHEADLAAVRERFAGSRFEIEKFEVMDRAGWLEVGLRTEPIQDLAGCDLVGSRPIQHLHITPAGKCVLCCQDYDENYVVGDLNLSTIAEILAGDEMATMRKWSYGVEQAPDDFICRRCVFALARS